MGYDPDAVQREVNRQLSQNEAPAEYYVVQENDTLSEIAKRFCNNLSGTGSMEWNCRSEHDLRWTENQDSMKKYWQK